MPPDWVNVRSRRISCGSRFRQPDGDFSRLGVCASCAGRRPDSLAQPEQSAPFTGVHPRYNGFSLGVIEAYCRARHIGHLGRERVRVFVQPWGTVSGAIEVDLRQHTVRVWPDWWDSKTPMTTRGLSPKDARDLRALVTSAAFRKIPAENEAFGADGCAYLIESTVGGSYTWKLHWQPDDPTFLGVVGRLGALDRQR